MNAKMSVHVVTSQKPEVTSERADGWGDRAVVTKLKGKALDITIANDGDPAISIRISDEGDLTITNYGSFFSMDMERNLRLKNNAPWP
jgi:hypothetical protein